MKLITKSILLLVVINCIMQTGRSQSTAGNRVAVGKFVTVAFPDTVTGFSEGIQHSFFSKGTTAAFELNYFDTVVVRVKSRDDFNICLKGYVGGKYGDPQYKDWDLTLKDTSVAGLPGVFITGITNDTAAGAPVVVYGFITIVNSRSYWIYAYQFEAGSMSKEIKDFFRSVRIVKNKIRETKYKVERTRKHKAPGKVWYRSPELDAPFTN